MNRSQRLLLRIDKSMKVLEVGPAFSPVVAKSDGWNAWAVDHTDQEGLRQKYRDDPTVDTDRIGPVDFVWQGGALDEAIPATHHGSFDACIASHAIEHMPDPISFYQSLDKLCRMTGVIALAVPDKRFCFDYFRPVSMTSDFILAHLCRRPRHSKKTAFEHTAYTVSGDGAAAWGQHPVGELQFYSNLETAFRLLTTTEESGAAPYVDYHGWCYTPSSFKLIMLELNVLGLIDWVVDVDYPAEGCEFIVLLKKGRLQFPSDRALQDVRRTLAKGILADIAEQHRYASQSEPEPSKPEPQTVPVPSPMEPPPPAADDLVGDVAVLQQQYRDLAERLDRQEARLAKIRAKSKMIKRLLRPVRAIAGISRKDRTP
ncbi:MAG: hypothetical protein U1E66_00255 [Rhodospirillales bacterium]